MPINSQNMKWALRMMAIILITGIADILVVLYAKKPLPWAAIVPALIPILTTIFIIIPMQRERKAPTAS